MKKLLLIALMAVCSLYVQAQTTLLTKDNNSNSISYIRAGVNASTFSEYNDIDGAETSLKIGYNVAYGFHKEFSQSGLYWGMEAGLGSRGYIMSYDGYYDGDAMSLRDDLWAHNVQVTPLNLGFKHEIANNLKIDIHVGGYASYDYAGSYCIKDDDNSNEKGNTLEYYSLGELESYKAYDAGMTVGLGVWFNNKYNLDFNFQNGFIGINENGGDDNPKTRNFSVRLGIGF
ncbi:MAG: outer membrane beta-barrel protein [Rikenellaceae bacterium]